MKITTGFYQKPLGRLTKFCMQAFRYKGMKIYTHDAAHMTKMAIMPIYGNDRNNDPVNAHLIAEPSISRNHKKPD